MAVQATIPSDTGTPSSGIGGSTLPVQGSSSGNDGGFLTSQPISKPSPGNAPPSAGQGGEVYVPATFTPNDTGTPSSGVPGGQVEAQGSVHDAHAPFHFVDGDTCHVGYVMWTLPDGSLVCISDLEYAKAQIGDFTGYLSQFYGPPTNNTPDTGDNSTTDSTSTTTSASPTSGSTDTTSSDESILEKLIGLVGQQFASGGTTAQDGQGSVVALPTEVGTTSSNSGTGKAVGIALLFIAGGIGYYFYRKHKKKAEGAK